MLGASGKPVPLVAPVSDLLGLRADWQYAVRLHSTYGPFWPEIGVTVRSGKEAVRVDLAVEAETARIEWISAEAARLRKRELPRLFLDASRLAAEGRLSAKLAPFLERVLRRPGEEPDDVPDGDLPALAAWALDEVLRISRVEVRNCPLCKVPWVASATQPSPYCERPFPGRHMSCRELKKDEHFRESQRDWRREYKRVHERVRRGTVSDAEWEAWRKQNSPGAWIAFDTWIERKRKLLEGLPEEQREAALASLSGTKKR